MATSFRFAVGVLSVAVAACVASASAQTPRASSKSQAPGQSVSAATPSAQMSPKMRGQLTREFVTKWGAYVQRVYDIPVDVWAQRMVPNFVNADASNFRNAMKRATFEGAMAELSGSGQRISDNAVIDRLAKATPGQLNSPADVVAAKFGDLNQDLVYTPIQPCRIIDTRSTGAGAIAANATRSFVAINASNFTSQGGSATNCGTLGLAATAVAINLTAVTPSGAGYATAYPFGTTQPVAASVNYAAGSIVNNALIVQIPNPIASFDFTIYTFAQSHYVADIVGYFAPPLATALQCQNTAVNSTTVAAGAQANVVAPACATGYTQTATNCESSSWTIPFVFIKDGVCSAQNNGASNADIRASRTCCRVPGR